MKALAVILVVCALLSCGKAPVDVTYDLDGWAEEDFNESFSGVITW